MGLILPQEVEIKVGNMRERYEKLGYKIPTVTKNGKEVVSHKTIINISVLDLTERSHQLVNLCCDECGETYQTEYRYYTSNYCMRKIGKTFCKKCVNTSMAKYKINDANVWRNREYALLRLNNFIKENKTLKGWTVNNTEGASIANRFREYGYNLEEFCTELGYNYLELKGLKHPECYFYDYNNLISEINLFIEEKGYFPTQKEMIFDLGISGAVIQKFGGSHKLKADIEYTKNEFIDDFGFYNRSHYEYMVAQFLIHNNITYKREQNPFPEPYHNL